MPTAHRIPVSGDQSVAAIHHETDADIWFVTCHGLVSDKEGSYEGRCERAVEEGYQAVRFDFRGCGDSDGDFEAATLSARVRDLQAVLKYFDPGRVVLFGSSFGGTVALRTAVDGARVVAVATRAPATFARTFEDYRRAVAEHGEYRFETGHRLDDRFLVDLADYDFETIARRLTVPVAIFHGSDDESVPLTDSIAAVGEMTTDVALFRFQGEGHRFGDHAEVRMQNHLFDWLSRELAT